MSNKIIVAILILLTLGVFSWLIDYGWTHRYGSPETYQVSEPNLLAVNYQPEEFTLKPDDVFAEIWQKVPSIELMLRHQVTELPWPRELTPTVKVQAFHNGKDIYFKMTWQDDQADATVSLDKFTDGCALAVSMDANAPVPSSIMMGFSSAVNIWHWQADKDVQYWENKTIESTAYTDYLYPFEEQEVLPITMPKLNSAVADLLAQRAGSLTRKETQIVQGRGQWREGSWSVIFKRSLTTNDSQRDCQFAWGQRSASFAVWDGDQNDRGARKSISEWVNLQIEPQPQELADKEASDNIVWAENTPASRALSLSLLSSAYGATLENKSAHGKIAPRIINIKAKRFQYTPNQIVVQKGELVTILMESLDVTHGFYLDGYGINIKARPGLIGKATFVADKAGRFTFRCSETCGEFHPYMIGFLKVTPNSRFHLFIAAVCVAFVIMLGIVLYGARQKKEVEKNAAGTD